MENVERARELFARLEDGNEGSGSEIALRTFEARDRLSRIRG
jgi:hypothetical protein